MNFENLLANLAFLFYHDKQSKFSGLDKIQINSFTYHKVSHTNGNKFSKIK